MTDRLTVRMYSMGFGDCFLLTFWSGDEAKHVLFDCGSLSRTKAEVSKVAGHIVSTCSGPDGIARLALVVCTHRHKDHVLGFDDPIWAKVEVDEVWMPWTEHPTDPIATRIRNRQSALALALCKSISPGFSPDAGHLMAPLDGRAFSTFMLALNALTNDKAMTTLHRGFAGKPPRRFLPEGNDAGEVRSLPCLPGVRFHVLGPSRLESVIKDMDPPDGAAYLSMADASTIRDDAIRGACESRWRVDETTFNDQRKAKSTFSSRDKRAVDRLAEEPDGDLAAAIDKAVNNTSLVLMIEIGDQFLLFPGDAQWGTWKVIMDDPDLRQLLQRTTLLKVSHHGSHNGTPKALVDELLKQGVVALVSTGSVKQWPGIPRIPLMTAFDTKAKLVRTDKVDDFAGLTDLTVEKGLFIEWAGHVDRT